MWYDDLTETVPKWLATLRSSGGLYRLSASAHHEESLDATTLALDLMQMLRMGPSYDDVDNCFRFIDDCQDPQTGFHNEFFSGELREPERSWAAAYCSFQVCGVMEAYRRLPDTAFWFYDSLRSPGAVTRYMSEEMPWATHSTGAGHMVDQLATMCRMNVAMGFTDFWHVLHEMYQWLGAEQFGGAWGKGYTEDAIQAAYHVLRGTYFRDKVPVDWGRLLMNDLTENLKHFDGIGDACHYMDHAVMMEQLFQRLVGKVWLNAVRPVASKMLSEIQVMRQSDGGFSFSASGAIDHHNWFAVSPGEQESDLVGTVFYMETIYRLGKILELNVPWGTSCTHGVI